MKDKEIYVLCDKLLLILENNYKYGKGKEVSLNEQFEIYKNLYSLFNQFSTKSKKIFNNTSKLVIKRYIPVLDLVINIAKKEEHKVEYEKHLKNAYKIAARTSFEHYMVYREWEIPYKEKFFEPRYDIMKGYIHYLEEIETNPTFYNLVSNMPSGYGKTFPRKLAEAWGLGIDDTGTFLSLCSNEAVVLGGSDVVKNEICSEWFGEVFPNLNFSKDDKDFFLKETQKEWKLKNCKLMATYYASTINANVVGQRASKSIHIDDLYKDYVDSMNMNENEKLYNNYLTVWSKRYIMNKIPKSVITGTLWSRDDFIDRIINQFKTENHFIMHPKYPYVWINIDKEEDLGKESIAIIQIPALDYDTGESTCPELKTTEDLLKEKNRMPLYLWETNFQQMPTNPEALMFSYDKIRSYETIPEDESSKCYAVIDSTRKSGKDYFAMPIFKRINSSNLYDYYLVDTIFTKKATKDMYDEVIEKIIEHHINFLTIESNVSGELKSNLEKKLKNLGINWCKITEVYQKVSKSVRITDASYLIHKQMVFPKSTMYGNLTDMGKFMSNLTQYNSNGRNTNDDAPDSLAMFASEYIDIGKRNNIVEAVRRFF